MKKRRNYAVLLFVCAMIFFAVEVFAVCTAKSQYDYRRAKETAEELSVELGLISSAIGSGNQKLLDDSIARYRDTLNAFADNEYSHRYQAELLSDLRGYNDLVNNDRAEISEFIELSAALSAIRSELQNNNTDKLDATNFYHLQETFQALESTLGNIKSENLATARQRLADFASDIIELAKSSAVCVSVCPKDSFGDKQAKLNEIKTRYSEEFKSLGLDASKKYDTSELIVRLSKI